MSKHTKAKIRTIPWDSAAHLKTDQEIEPYLEAMCEDGDAASLENALRVVARAKSHQRDW